jgi:hypothetical protein
MSDSHDGARGALRQNRRRDIGEIPGAGPASTLPEFWQFRRLVWDRPCPGSLPHSTLFTACPRPRHRGGVALRP